MNVKLNPELPFIFYTEQRECPTGLYTYRNYPNYLEGQERVLTESAMAFDLLGQFLGASDKNVKISYTKNNSDGSRANTETTSRDAALELANKIKSGFFVDKKNLLVLLQSNNPYIERQALIAQRQVDLVLRETGLDSKYKIKVEGVGFTNKQSIEVVCSELAALIATRYLNAEIKTTRDVSTLMFQTRVATEDSYDLPPAPDTNEILKNANTYFNYFVDYFDDTNKKGY
ncbi:MAG: hypothetical protein SFT91_05490 [Rickettsiaceae bacterium]|nr:hypothetical protein [Rickettsiaceae bacterium]